VFTWKIVKEYIGRGPRFFDVVSTPLLSTCIKELCPLCREKKDCVRGKKVMKKLRPNKTTPKKHGPLAVLYGKTDQKSLLSWYVDFNEYFA
jgi:hypothetical protein